VAGSLSFRRFSFSLTPSHSSTTNSDNTPISTMADHPAAVYDSDDDEAPTLVELGEEKSSVQEDSDKPCPVTILSGFLGAGKTTLIQYILNGDHGKRIAVIENEFGEGLNIESLIARDGINNESLTDLIELPNGCICCQVKDSLVATLETLLKRARHDLDYILIECSGMANPGPIASLFWLDEGLSRLKLDGIVTIIDAAHIQEQLASTIEAAQQLAYAERILLNKIDLVEDETTLEQIVKRIRQIHPTAPIQRTTYSAVPNLNWILDTECLDVDRIKEVEQVLNNKNEHHHDHDDKDCPICQPYSHQHTAAISTVAFQKSGSVDLQQMNQWLASILWPNQDEHDKVLRARLEESHELQRPSNDDTTQRLFRIKGILSVHNSTQRLDPRRYIVQAVHDLWDIYPASQDLEWTNDEERSCKVVIIGRNLQNHQLEQGLESCLI